MRVISAMTFLFRLDVSSWGGGGNEGFSHSVCEYMCVCVPVCVHMHKLDCVSAQTIAIPTASLCGICLSLQFCRNGLRPVDTLSTIFRDYLFFSLN